MSNTGKIKNIYFMQIFTVWQGCKRSNICCTVQADAPTNQHLPPYFNPGVKTYCPLEICLLRERKTQYKEKRKHVATRISTRRNILQRERKKEKKINCQCKINWGLNKSAKKPSRYTLQINGATCRPSQTIIHCFRTSITFNNKVKINSDFKFLFLFCFRLFFLFKG